MNNQLANSTTLVGASFFFVFNFLDLGLLGVVKAVALWSSSTSGSQADTTGHSSSAHCTDSHDMLLAIGEIFSVNRQILKVLI